VPQAFTDGGYRLEQRVGTQRRIKSTIDLDRRRRLEALPDWSWHVLSDKWEEGFLRLKNFLDREGHTVQAHDPLGHQDKREEEFQRHLRGLHATPVPSHRTAYDV
jgi:hypothetical protein